MPPKTFTINLTGDVMLGRLIDQLRPTHVDNSEEASHILYFLRSNPHLKSYSSKTPWGNTLRLFHSGNLNIINLETSVTTHPMPWPNKVFNYRMHPGNVDFLREPGVNYVSLANNHTLDFCEDGVVETLETLEKEGIAFAGAGRTREEVTRPAVLPLKSSDGNSASGSDDGGQRHEVAHVYSASDHPRDWTVVPGIHLIDYTPQTRLRLKKLLHSSSPSPPSSSSSDMLYSDDAALKIFSVHWGPNYSWRPSQHIQELAHFLVDECGVDIVHGHSSHHVQGVEVYKKKLIIYGCGDFVDDYAVDPDFRNDISALWRVVLSDHQHDEEDDAIKPRVRKLEIYPTLCKRFVTNRLEKNDRDYSWARDKIKELSEEFGTKVVEAEGEDKRPMLVVEIDD